MTDPASGDEPASGAGPPRAIAVDGSAASGKSTIGRKLASALGYRFLDTGVMYRAVTWAALDRGVDVEDDAALSTLSSSLDIEVTLDSARGSPSTRVMVDGADVTDRLRAPEVEANVSIVSRVAGVREALVAMQREIAHRQSIVMAGRDIGTVVLPEARLKVYLDASLSERSRRRHQEFERSGRSGTESEVMGDLQRRDQIDTEREVSPLKPAPDAIRISTDGREVDEILQQVLELATAGPA